MKNLASIFLLAFLAAPVAFAVSATAAPADTSILPSSFNGWIKDATTTKTSHDPAIADQADAAVLKEYGFADAELATYTRDDRKMQVKAARFEDATGAFGAFTFYQQSQMQTENIGDEGASNNLRILFYRGNVLVDVLLDRVTAMSAGDLRALAATLSPVRGPESVKPGLPGNLPRQAYVSHSEHYMIGPVAMERLGVPLPPALVDFNRSPELVTGKYRSTWGEGNLVLVNYPTPQIAAEKMRAIQAAQLPGGPFYFKRTGPIVAIVNGNIPQDEAQSLLSLVNWDANVTPTEPTKPDQRNNIGNLIVTIFVMIGFILLLALIFGFAFGGARVVIKKLFPDKVFDRAEDVEIIRLNLK